MQGWLYYLRGFTLRENFNIEQRELTRASHTLPVSSIQRSPFVLSSLAFPAAWKISNYHQINDAQSRARPLRRWKASEGASWGRSGAMCRNGGVHRKHTLGGQSFLMVLRGWGKVLSLMAKYLRYWLPRIKVASTCFCHILLFRYLWVNN